MNHPDLVRNHILENWVFPNAAARNATGLYGTNDIGKIAYQQDTATYWRLTGITPSWASITPGTMRVMSTPVNPTAITSTSGAHLGLALAFTPVRTGNVLIVITGTVANNTASAGSKIELHYGGGAPPAFNAAPAGSAIGKAINPTNNAGTAALRMPFTVTALASSLGIGVAYWADLVLTATAGSINIYDLTTVIIET